MAHEESDESTRRTGVVRGRRPRDPRRLAGRDTAARDWVATVVLAVLALGGGAWLLSTSPTASPTAARPASVAAVVAGGAVTPIASSSSRAATAIPADQSANASAVPADQPTAAPTDEPTDEPTIVLPKTPNADPTDVPTDAPTPAGPAVIATSQPFAVASDLPVPSNELSPPVQPAASDDPDATEPPTISPSDFTVDSIGDGDSVGDPSLDISGAAPAGSSVTRDVPQWFDDHVTASVDGRWTMHIQLSPGDNELHFRLGDDRSTEIVLHVDLIPSP